MGWDDYLEEPAYRALQARKFREATTPRPKPRPSADVAYETAMSGRRTAERAAETKREAERAFMPPAPKPRGLETRQVPIVPITGRPPTTREAYEARPKLRTPLQAPSLRELGELYSETAEATSDILALRRGAPSWARTAYEEAALGTVAAGPTVLGFGAGAVEGALPPLRTGAGLVLSRAGRAGEVLEAAPGVVGRAAKAAFLEGTERGPAAARKFLAETGRFARGEAGAVGPLGRAGEELPIPRVTPPEAAAPEQLFQLTNGVPELSEITPRIAKLKQELAEPRVTDRKALERKLARLEAQRDVARISQQATSLEGAQTNHDNLIAELREVEGELERRTRVTMKPSERGGRRAPAFGTMEREEWKAQRAANEAMGRTTPVERGGAYREYSTPWLEERRGVLAEFTADPRYEPVTAAEEPLVGRARFTETGEVVQEPTYATEGELAGIRPTQGRMGIGAGQRPLETAGPMFRREAPPTAVSGLTDQPFFTEGRAALSANRYDQTGHIIVGPAAGTPIAEVEDVVRFTNPATADDLSRLETLGFRKTSGRGQVFVGPRHIRETPVAPKLERPITPAAEVSGAERPPVEPPKPPPTGGKPFAERFRKPAQADTYAAYEAKQAEERIVQGLQGEETRIGRPSEATPEYAQRQAAASSGGQPPRGTVPPIDAPMSNPQAAPRSMQSQVHESNWRLRLALNSADSRDTAIGERLMAGERQLFKFTKDKRLANVTNKVTGENPFWNDAFQRPNDYIWPTGAREYRDTIAFLVKAKTTELRNAGVVFRETKLLPGEDWMPRAVEEIRGEAVRGVKRAVGAKQAFQLPRWHEFVESGVANGVDYARPAATIETFLKAADTAIAHNEYKGIINRFGATGAERVGAESKQAVIDAFKARNAAKAELGKLQRAFLRATGDREAKTVLREQIADAKVALADTQTALNQARSGKARLMEFARRPRGPQEAYLPEPFAGGRIFPKEVMQQVERGLKPPENAVTSVLKAARDVNNVIKPIWASVDLSYTALQTAPALGVNPAAWAKMQAVVISSLADPTNYYAYVERNAATIDRMIAKGKIPWYGSDVMFDEALRGPVGKWVRKGLVVAKPLKVGNDLFGRSLNVTGTELWKQGETMIREVGEGAFSKMLASRFGPVAKGADAYEQLGSVIAHGTGRLSLQEMAKMGPLTDLVVGALPFAGRYWASWGLLLTDAVRGGMRGNLARRLIAGWAATGIGVYSLISYALGQEPNLDPRDGSKFLTVAAKGGRYGMGGTLHGFMLLAGRIANDPSNTPTTLTRYARSKSGPAASLLTDLISRETYTGEPLDTWEQRLNYLAMRSLPFAGQTYARGEGIEATLATATGLRAFPQSSFEHLTELVPDWAHMTDPERKVKAAENPEVRKWWDKQTRQAAGRGQDWAVFKQEQQQQDADAEQQLLALRDNPQATYADVFDAYSNYLQKRATLSQAEYGDTEFPPVSDLDRRADAYYAAGPTEFMTAVDLNAAFDAQDAILAADLELKQNILAGRILRWPSAEMQALATEMENAKDVRKQLYALPKKAGVSLEEQDALASYVTQVSYQMGQGMSRLQAVKAVTDDQDLRIRLIRYLRRRPNPERKAFQEAHKEELKWFEAVPLDEEMWVEEGEEAPTFETAAGPAPTFQIDRNQVPTGRGTEPAFQIVR